MSALANPGATALLLSFGPSRWRWLVEGASQEEVQTAFAGWQMLASKPAGTAGLGWPMNQTAPRWTGCAGRPSTTPSCLALPGRRPTISRTCALVPNSGVAQALAKAVDNMLAPCY